MSKTNLYSLSNKIRTILLTTIDKELSNNSKKNHILINTQSQEQLTKKFENYRNFAVECNETFKGDENNEDNNIIYDLTYNYSDNKFNYFFHSSKTNNECLFPKNYIIKSHSPKKKYVKKIKNSKISENNLSKLQIDSAKTLTTETESSFSCKEVVDFKNSFSLSNDNNNKKHRKKISVDLYKNSIGNRKDDSSKLINYCYKLKKPNDDTINEISEDDTSSNKENKNHFLFFRRIKNKYKSIPKKKIKKIINKKKCENKNSHNDDHLQISRNKKNTINFTNEMETYFDSIEKLYPKTKIKIPNTDKKLLHFELKEADDVHCKNIFQLHHCNDKSSEKKSKEKELEQVKKSLYIQEINKKQAHKKSQNLESYFKSSINNPIVLKNKQIKDKRGKEEKKDIYVATQVDNSNIKLSKKRFKSLKLLHKKIMNPI